MPDFNVGDRVRCIRTHDWGTEGDIGVIRRVPDGRSPIVVWENPAWRDLAGLEWYILPSDIELIEAQPNVLEPVDTQTIVRYAVVTQYPDADHPAVNFFTTQASAERLVRMVPEGGGIVLATKKIKIVVPIVTFPEMELDEDDNEVEEEDDGNAF